MLSVQSKLSQFTGNDISIYYNTVPNVGIVSVRVNIINVFVFTSLLRISLFNISEYW